MENDTWEMSWMWFSKGHSEALKKKKKTFTFKEEENKIKMVGCWKEMDMKNRKDKLF